MNQKSDSGCYMTYPIYPLCPYVSFVHFYLFFFFPFIKTVVDTFVKKQNKTKEKNKTQPNPPKTPQQHVVVLRTNYNTSWLKHL